MLTSRCIERSRHQLNMIRSPCPSLLPPRPTRNGPSYRTIRQRTPFKACRDRREGTRGDTFGSNVRTLLTYIPCSITLVQYRQQRQSQCRSLLLVVGSSRRWTWTRRLSSGPSEAKVRHNFCSLDVRALAFAKAKNAQEVLRRQFVAKYNKFSLSRRARSELLTASQAHRHGSYKLLLARARLYTIVLPLSDVHRPLDRLERAREVKVDSSGRHIAHFGSTTPKNEAVRTSQAEVVSGTKPRAHRKSPAGRA